MWISHFYGMVKGSKGFLWHSQGVKGLFGVVKGQFSGQKILTLVASLNTAQLEWPPFDLW